MTCDSIKPAAAPYRSRFAPIPIETTYESVRLPRPQALAVAPPASAPASVPTPDLTPESSPRETTSAHKFPLFPTSSSSVEISTQHVEETRPSRVCKDSLTIPQPGHAPCRHLDCVGCVKQRRRFAPQLIETSRRARRIGDSGPATRPTDKTDITPYTNHIYLSHTRSKKRRNNDYKEHRVYTSDRARRETDDAAFSGYLLQLAAQEVERQIQEAALAAFPNAQAREGGVAHFYFRDSEEEDSPSAGASPRSTQDEVGISGVVGPHFHVRTHRAHHASTINLPRQRKSSDLDWWHKNMQEHAQKKEQAQAQAQAQAQTQAQTQTQVQVQAQTDTPMRDCAIDDDEYDEFDGMDIEMPPPDPLWLTTNRSASCMSTESDVYIDGDDYSMSYAPIDYSSSSKSHSKPSPPPVIASISINRGDPGGNGFGGRQFGGFARFGLPKESDDWRRARLGFSPPMLGKEIKFRMCPSPKASVTPQPAETPQQPISLGLDRSCYYEEVSTPPGLWRGSCLRTQSNEKTTYVPPGAPIHEMYLATPTEPLSPSYDPFSAAFGACNSPRPKKDQMFAQNRVRREAADARAKEKDRIEVRIKDEFDDLFVTQVFNYLSLGYPPTAQAFDQELSKISRVPVEELSKDDEYRMKSLKTFDSEEHTIPEDERCVRWKALKLYIFEWGRQHPDLDNCRPVAWGMRERRGSWAV
ncbi:hypothetical protein HOO65_011366 [Ceratocystis lukuohia]|uniref:Uncharacterized protein n=1 Tax=Ceratocystis lukuohia TaxID=2019550 RepID=A0ABR4MUR3_9PEZI